MRVYLGAHARAGCIAPHDSPSRSMRSVAVWPASCSPTRSTLMC